MGDDNVTEALALEPDDEPGVEPTPLRAVQAETAAEERVEPDGSIVVTLRTDLGEAPIRVPPINRWRSSARNAIFSRMDDLFWAGKTLTPQEFLTWTKLDPTQDDVEEFFNTWGELTGQALGESLASRQSSTRTPRR